MGCDSGGTCLDNIERVLPVGRVSSTSAQDAAESSLVSRNSPPQHALVNLHHLAYAVGLWEQVVPDIDTTALFGVEHQAGTSHGIPSANPFLTIDYD